MASLALPYGYFLAAATAPPAHTVDLGLAGACRYCRNGDFFSFKERVDSEDFLSAGSDCERPGFEGTDEYDPQMMIITTCREKRRVCRFCRLRNQREARRKRKSISSDGPRRKRLRLASREPLRSGLRLLNYPAWRVR